MAEFEAPPSFGGVRYDIGNVPNIGAGYAAGIAQAGEGIAKGVSGALDVMNRRQNAIDMLNALHAGGQLGDKAYQAVAGKSLGAQEQMIGMYANQWILDQANQRQQSLARGQGGVDVAVQHAKLLDTIQAIRGGNAPAAGVAQKQLLYQPPQPQQVQPVQTQQPQQQPQPPQTQLQIAQTQGPSAAGPRPQQPNVTGAPRLPGARYVQRTDPATGQTQTGTLYPSGTFIQD